MLLKYYTKTLFDAVAFSSANTSGTSEQFDIAQFSALWLLVTATNTDTSTDCSVQLYVSNDPISTLIGDSTWIAEGSAATFSGTASFDKHSNLVAQKAKIVVTRNASTATLTLRAVGKLINASAVGNITSVLFGSTPNSSGLSFAAGTLTLQPADATHPGGVSTSGQSFVGNKTIVGTIAATNLSGTNTGDVTLADFDTSPNSAGASFTNQVLTIQPADATHPGGVSTTTQSFLGAKTFLTQLIGKGTTTNDSAAAGYIGEILSVSKDSTAGVSLVNATPKTIASLALSAGDYEMFSALGFAPAGSTVMTSLACAVSTTDNGLPGRTAELQGLSNQVRLDWNMPAGTVPGGNLGFTLPPIRVSLAAATTLYLVGYAEFSVSTVSGFGSITVRRLR